MQVAVTKEMFESLIEVEKGRKRNLNCDNIYKLEELITLIQLKEECSLPAAVEYIDRDISRIKVYYVFTQEKNSIELTRNLRFKMKAFSSTLKNLLEPILKLVECVRNYAQELPVPIKEHSKIIVTLY
jgi:hypothetical protein